MRNAKRLSTAFAAVCAMSMALAGCGNGGNDAASDGPVTKSDGNVTITINWWGGDNRIKQTQKVVEAFEKEHPNITVDAIYADWSGYWDKLATSIAGGDAPDVIQMDEMYLAAYGSQGSLLDLDRAKEFLKTDELDKSVADMGKYDGKQYAMPQSTTPFGLAVNLDILDKLGVKLPDNTDSWTWDEFNDFQKEIYDKSNGEVVGALMPNNGYGLTLWARQHGEDLFKGGKMVISEGTLAKFFDKTLDLIKAGMGGDGNRWAEQSGLGVDQSAFGTGKAALNFTQSTQITAYSKAAGTENMVLVNMPSDTKGGWGYIKPGMYWSVSSRSQHPAEAAMLVDYLVNSETAGKIIGTERGIPANNKVRASLAKTLEGPDKKAMDFVDTFEKVTGGEAPEITPNGASDIMKTIGRYQEAVVFGKQTPAEAAKAMIEEMNSSITSAS